jgi:DNA topoisomerase-3
LGAFYPDAEFAQTEVMVKVGPGDASPPAQKTEQAEAPKEDAALIADAPPPPDRFLARGKVRLVAGWQEVAGFGGEDEAEGKKGKKKDSDEDEPAVLPPLQEGQRLAGAFEAPAKKTKPPSRHSEASLLSAMENAGKNLGRPDGEGATSGNVPGFSEGVDDEELRSAMKDCGLGTPATRAATIETLLKRGFIAREGKHLCATPVGMALVDALPVPSLSSPELTGAWEARLARMARGEDRREAFMADIGRYVREMVDAIRAAAPMRVVALPEVPAKPKKAPRRSAKDGQTKPRKARATAAAAPAPTLASKPPTPQTDPVEKLACPRCQQGHLITGKRGWGCSRWREGCKFVVWFEENGQSRSVRDLQALMASGAAR